MAFLEQLGGEMRILYLGTRDSIEGLESAAFTKLNTGAYPAVTAQLAANLSVAGITKLGCLAGTVAAVHGESILGAGTGPTDACVGLYVNDLAGNAFESSSAAASEKGVYVHSFGTYEVKLYETHSFDGMTNIMGNYAAGKYLYCSQNGLLTIVDGLSGGTVPSGAVVMGIITKAPTSADPFMRFNLRV
jgi:hypothetical protein